MQSLLSRSKRARVVRTVAVAYLTLWLAFPVNVVARPLSERVAESLAEAWGSFGSLAGALAQDEYETAAAPGEDAAARVTHFRLSPRRVLLYGEETFTLSPVPLGSGEEVVDFAPLEWWSENEAVAAVSSWGQITAVSPGRTFVVVRSGQAQARVLVDVREGYRPAQTDEEWDAEHPNDDADPQAGAAEGAERVAAETASREGAPRDGGVLPLGWLRRAVAHVVADEEAPRGGVVPVAQQDGEQWADDELAADVPDVARSVEPDGPDGYAPQAVSNENAVGTPRLEGFERSEGPTQTLNHHGSFNYQFAAPVLSLAGREAGVDLALVYNSRLWTKDTSGGATTMTFNYGKGWPAPGWRLGYGRIVENYDDSDSGNGSGVGNLNKPGNSLLILPDGTRVPLLQTYDSAAGKYKHKTYDGTFLRFNMHNGKLAYPDGTVVTYATVNNRLLPQSVQSPNGNMVTIAYKTRNVSVAPTDPSYFPLRWAIASIADTAGRQILFEYDNQTGNLLRVTAPTEGTNQRRTLVELRYKDILFQYAFNTAFAVTAPLASGSQLTVLDRIYYPATGRGYVLADYSSYGMARRIELYTGMTASANGTRVAYTSYNYETFVSGQRLDNNPKYTERREWWSGKTDEAGTSTSAESVYSYIQTNSATTKVHTTTYPGAPQLQVVTTTDNDPSSQSYGKVLSVELKDFTNPKPLRTLRYTYTTPADGGLQREAVVSEEWNAVASSAERTKVAYTYGEFGRVKSVTEYDVQANGSYPPVRETRYHYADEGVTDSTYTDETNQKGWFLRLVDRVTVYEGATLKAKTEYVYDDYSTKPLMTYGAALSTHDSNFNTATYQRRGLVTAVKEWANVADPTPVTRHRKYDVFGNLVEQEVTCCRSKTYSYSAATQFIAPDSVTDGTSPSLVTAFTYEPSTLLLTSVEAPGGQETGYQYDAAWRLWRVTAPSGAVTETTWQDSELAVTEKTTYTDTTTKTITSKSWTDGAGRVVRSGTGAGASPPAFDAVAVKYDSRGRAMWQSNPYAGNSSGNANGTVYWTKTSFDALSRPRTVTLPDNQAVSTLYDGLTTTSTDQAGRKRQAVADGLGRAKTVYEQNPSTGALDWRTDYSYDVFDNVTLVKQYAAGSTTSYQQRTAAFDALGRMTSRTTPEGGQETFAYDSWGALVTHTDARGVETHYQHDTLNRVTKIWYTGPGGSDDPNGSRPPLPSGVAATPDVTITYHTSGSGKGQVKNVLDYTDGATARGETFAYDAAGRVQSRTREIGAGAERRSYTVGYAYNGLDQLTTLTYPSGKQVRQTYDERARVESVQELTGAMRSYVNSTAYTAAGQLQTATLGNGVTESYGYSPTRLQLTSQTAAGGTTLMSLAYSYQGAAGAFGAGTTAGNTGQLASITGTVNGQSANQTFKYDTVGRLTAATGSTSGAATSGTDTAGAYDPATGSFFLRNANSSGGADVTFGFGPSSSTWLPIAGDWNGDGVDTIGLYDPASGTFYLKNANASGGADLLFSFGGGGSTVQPLAGDWNGDGVDTIGFYDSATGSFFLRNSNTAGGADVTLSFGAGGSGWKAIAGDWNGDGTDTIGVYDPATSSFYLRNANSAGGADLAFGFGGAGSTPLAGDWNDDGVDTIGTWAAGSWYLRDANSSGGADVTFSYASGGVRPITGDWDGAPSSPGGSVTWGRSYGYDRWGNRKEVRDTTTGGVLQTVNFGTAVPTNRVVSAESAGGPTTPFSYDKAGNLTNDGTAMSYDGAGRMATAMSGTASYSYDAANRRTRKVAGGVTTHYVWEGGAVLAEYNGATGALVAENVYAGGRMLAREEGSAVTYYHQDRLSARVMTNAAGGVVGTQSHYPFGEEASASGTQTKTRFTTYERDAESGTDYAVNRQYQNALGRFTRPDPVQGSANNPQSFNRYAYTLNDPVNLIDPLGLNEEVIHLYGWTSIPWVDFPHGLGGDYIYSGPDSGGGGVGGRAGIAWDRLFRDFWVASRLNRECANRLAGLFGGDGAVVMTTHEPPEIQKNRGLTGGGSRLPGHGAPAYNENPNPKSTDRGGIIHIYGNEHGTAADSPLYVPRGFYRVPKVDPGSNNRMAFSSSLLGLTIVFVHVGRHSANAPGTNRAGSSLIGGIGGPGGATDLKYIHTHIAFYSEFDKNNPAGGTRVDPRDYFCKDFGFGR